MGFFEIFALALAFFYAVIPSYGLAIVLLTTAVRLLLLPLSIKQSRSMREMQRLRPEIKRLQTKYKGKRQELNEEMMKLYKEHGVNPFGGCLPLLAQFPILIALFYVIRQPLQYVKPIDDWALVTALRERPLATNSFLGLRLDCTPSEVFAKSSSATVEALCGTSIIDFVPYLLLIGAMGFTTYYQSRQMQVSPPAKDDPQAQAQQMMGKLMPAMFVVFGFSFPTGVVLYWVVTNLWTIGQQRLMLGPRTDAETAADKATKGRVTEKPKTPRSGKSAEVSRPGSPSQRATGSKPHPSSKKKRKR